MYHLLTRRDLRRLLARHCEPDISSAVAPRSPCSRFHTERQYLYDLTTSWWRKEDELTIRDVPWKSYKELCNAASTVSKIPPANRDATRRPNVISISLHAADFSAFDPGTLSYHPRPVLRAHSTMRWMVAADSVLKLSQGHRENWV